MRSFNKHLFFKKSPSLILGLFILGVSLLGGARYSATDPQIVKRDLIAPPVGFERFVFGFNEAIADLLWIRAIQDFDYCDRPLNQSQCRGQSWLFKMLDATTNLSPRFRMPYATGSLALSVMITDINGATQIFEKGLKAFPMDWSIAYRAAYHYLYEVQDKKRAADLLLVAAKNGGPFWLSSLASRLYAESGNAELAEAMLKDLENQGAEPQILERMKQKIESIKKTAQ